MKENVHTQYYNNQLPVLVLSKHTRFVIKSKTNSNRAVSPPASGKPYSGGLDIGWNGCLPVITIQHSEEGNPIYHMMLIRKDWTCFSIFTNHVIFQTDTGPNTWAIPVYDIHPIVPAWKKIDILFSQSNNNIKAGQLWMLLCGCNTIWLVTMYYNVDAFLMSYANTTNILTCHIN